MPTAIPVAHEEPSPLLAGLLGLIPGVGAMYNGQFAKGVVHLVIFVILVFMSDNVNGVFGLFVAGWILYQAFEAYHTAIARRDGLPLPNAFGFNDIGERMGFNKNWSAPPNERTGHTTVPPPVTPWAAGETGPAPMPAAGPGPQRSAGQPTSGPDWVGYIPPTAFASTTQAPPVPPVEPIGQARQVSGAWGYAPYEETYTASGSAHVPPGSFYGPGAILPPAPPVRRFPVGALWLIGLGVLILLANLVPDWRITGRWLPSLLFAGLSLWLFTRRLHSGVRIACIIRWPAILMVLAIFFALHAAYVPITFGMMCAVLLIAFGALLLLERTVGAEPGNVAPGVGFVAEPVYGTTEENARAAFTAPGPVVGTDPGDVAKGGR
jgi:hypothetical protein